MENQLADTVPLVMNDENERTETMTHKIQLELELDQGEYDALQVEADFRLIRTVEEYLEVMIRDQVRGSMTDFEELLSEEELREFQHRYGEEDWIDDIDPEIPF